MARFLPNYAGCSPAKLLSLCLENHWTSSAELASFVSCKMDAAHRTMFLIILHKRASCQSERERVWILKTKKSLKFIMESSESEVSVVRGVGEFRHWISEAQNFTQLAQELASKRRLSCFTRARLSLAKLSFRSSARSQWDGDEVRQEELVWRWRLKDELVKKLSKGVNVLSGRVARLFVMWVFN